MTKERKHEPIVVDLDRGKLLRANGATFIFGGGLVVLALLPWRRVPSAVSMLAIFLRVLLLVWGWFSLPVLARLLFPKPIVTVDDKGISYSPPRTGPFAFGGSLGWGEIKALYVGELTLSRRGKSKVQRFLCVLPRDVEAFLRRYTIMSMGVLAMIMMQVGSPFVLPEAMLSLSVDELFALVRAHYADTIEEYGIELRKVYKGTFTASKKKVGEVPGENWT